MTENYKNDSYGSVFVDMSKGHLVCFLSKIKRLGGFKNIFSERSIRNFGNFPADPYHEPLAWFMIVNDTYKFN